jgi:pimeloyl-ACP methyl ester carboxylesterase
MATLSTLRPHQTLTLGLTLGLTLSYILRNLLTSPSPGPPISAPSPPAESQTSHPYPPSALPNPRRLLTPYGALQIHEFGPPTGEKVLFLPGISTPCVALSSLATHLAQNGYRVMLFDYFGRGYSDAPDPATVPYDEGLYSAMILMALAGSELSWTGDEAFHLVGYSLGGGLAAAFARRWPRMVRSLGLLCSGGLIRRDVHVGVQSRLLYSRGWLPERLIRWLIRRRITPVERREGGASVVDGIREEARRLGKEKKESDASGGNTFDNAVLAHGRTVAEVMGWQVREHRGFVGAFVSTIRYAPIYDQREIWGELGRELERRRKEEGVPGLKEGRVMLVLGEADGVIVKEELVEDATKVLGEDGIEVVQVEGGHEVPFTKGREIGDILMRFWTGEEVLAEPTWSLS